MDTHDMISRQYLLDKVQFDGRVVFVSKNDVLNAPPYFSDDGFCDWCQGLAADIVYGNGYYGEVYKGHLIIGNKELNKEGSRKINFCPMCGRKL